MCGPLIGISPRFVLTTNYLPFFNSCTICFNIHFLKYLKIQDYTGSNVTAVNFYAVLLGDKKAVKGGSGKVINSKANDHIFVYYSDHGGPGVLGNYFINILLISEYNF